MMLKSAGLGAVGGQESGPLTDEEQVLNWKLTG